MNIKTKFDCGDKVLEIDKKRESIFIKCGFCDGIGRVVGADKNERICPECYDKKGKKEYKDLKWTIGQRLTIGQIRVEYTAERCDIDSMFSNYGNQKKLLEEKYMCYETGISSGTVYNAKDLFLNEESALKECGKRNKEIANEQ